jgi:hypothetical protein
MPPFIISRLAGCRDQQLVHIRVPLFVHVPFRLLGRQYALFLVPFLLRGPVVHTVRHLHAHNSGPTDGVCLAGSAHVFVTLELGGVLVDFRTAGEVLALTRQLRLPLRLELLVLNPARSTL